MLQRVRMGYSEVSNAAVGLDRVTQTSPMLQWVTSGYSDVSNAAVGYIGLLRSLQQKPLGSLKSPAPTTARSSLLEDST